MTSISEKLADAAAKAGFKAVEFLFPYDFPAAEVAARLNASGLQQVLFNAPPGDWTKGERGQAALPGRQAEFREGFRKALDYMPKAMRRVMWTYLERRLAPWGGRVPLRVDWFAGKGLRPRAPQVIERPVAEGRLVSDHNPILVDLELGPDGESDMSEESDE